MFVTVLRIATDKICGDERQQTTAMPAFGEVCVVRIRRPETIASGKCARRKKKTISPHLDYLQATSQLPEA